MCYSDKRCMTAVYRKNGDCLFIRNFADTLTIEDDSQSYDITEEILEMKTKTDTGKIGSQVRFRIFFDTGKDGPLALPSKNHNKLEVVLHFKQQKSTASMAC